MLLTQVKTRNQKFKNLYVLQIAVQVYTQFDFQVSEEARKMILHCEFLLLGEARQGHK